MCLSVLVVHLLIILLTQTKHCACIYAVLPQVLLCMPTSHVLRTLMRRLFDRLCSRAAPLYSHACIVNTITPIDCDASGLCQCHVGLALSVLELSASSLAAHGRHHFIAKGCHSCLSCWHHHLLPCLLDSFETTWNAQALPLALATLAVTMNCELKQAWARLEPL